MVSLQCKSCFPPHWAKERRLVSYGYGHSMVRDNADSKNPGLCRPGFLHSYCYTAFGFVLETKQISTSNKRRNYQRYNSHKLDKNVQRRAGCIFEGVAYCVANYCGFMCIAALAAKVAAFDVFLGVISGATGVGHKNGHTYTAGGSTGKKTTKC